MLEAGVEEGHGEGGAGRGGHDVDVSRRLIGRKMLGDSRKEERRSVR